jgi:uncharacterized damage-inducible protein DinB
MENIMTQVSTETAVITPAQLLRQWQHHRNLTRRVIEAFPEKELYNYSIGGMRTFAELAMEIMGMAVPGLKGIVSGDWENGQEVFSKTVPPSKKELLDMWDETTEQISFLWSKIPLHRFQEVDVAFGLYEGPGYYTIWYWIDNEIHYRGQGYVYLRSLGIEPPPFWDRPV